MKNSPCILIAGAHGFLGARAMERYPSAIGVDSALLRNPGEELRAFVREYRPELILNAAAISDIGACEQDPEGSYRANVMLPVILAQAAQEVGAKLVSFSSDQVYTGCQEAGPYAENQTLPEPANRYARMLRATWMYDMPLYAHPNRGNFLVNTMKAVGQGSPVRVPWGQYRGITYVRQVVENLDAAFNLPGGVYNYGSENPLTMLETAEALLRTLDLKGTVEDTGERRHNLWMDCGLLRQSGIHFDTTAEGFARCGRDYGL